MLEIIVIFMIWGIIFMGATSAAYSAGMAKQREIDRNRKWEQRMARLEKETREITFKD